MKGRQTMRIINADQLEGKMYHEAFENDVSYDERNPMARWDSGLWIRYKLFEKCLENTPTIDAADRPQGEWITKTVKKFCAPDCWYAGTFAIEGSWDEEEGSWLEEQDGFCSECGKQDEHYYGHKYCPNCGARMK